MFGFLKKLLGRTPKWPVRYREGIDWFNRKHFPKAQLAWEYLYRGSEGELRELYKALMQWAGGLRHIQNGNLDGGRQLLNGARDLLAKRGKRLGGLDLQQLRGGLEACSDELVEVEEGRKEHFSMAHVPALILR